MKERASAKDELRLVAWELTSACNLRCIHCRAAACDAPSPDELTTEECYAVINDIISFARPIVILTGGEPLLRSDVFNIASYGTQNGLRMVMATNGTLLDAPIARRCVKAGIKRISVSLDGCDAKVHDKFRRMPGAFEGSMHGIEAAKEAGLEFQINSSLTMQNLDQLPGLLRLAVELGAVAHHIFMLVPVGRGENLKGVEISAEKYEETLNWIYDQKVPLQIKVTCAPQYYRILRQRARAEGRKVTMETHGLDAVTRGCLGGKSFCFISHSGRIQPCGYLELDCGNVRKEGLSTAWRESKIFHDLRDLSAYKGKCGMCEYKAVCGGCRARAHAKTGDYLAEETCCVYVPKRKQDEP
ncbi:MAG: heme b synthase [Planctomycetota bacterium]